MRARDRRRGVSTCIPVSGGEGKQAHNDGAPDEKRERPMRLQISCWRPVKLGFSGASLTLRKERRRPHHFSGLANSFVPKNVECFIARKWGCACFRMGLFFAGDWNRRQLRRPQIWTTCARSFHYCPDL